MTIRTALALLWRDRRHLTLAISGVVFAVVLLTLQSGRLLGSLRAASCLVDRTTAAVWVSAPGLRSLAESPPLGDAVFYRLRTVPGVARVTRLLVRRAEWTTPTGRRVPITVVGFDPASGLVRPWRRSDVAPPALSLPESVAVDASARFRLGLTSGQRNGAIGGRRARVFIYTHGIRPLDGRPIVFTALETARRYTGITAGRATAFLVRPAAGVDATALRDAIQKAIPSVAAMTRQELRQRLASAWLFTSESTMTLVLAVCFGLLVGGLTVRYALVATTWDHHAQYVELGAEGLPFTMLRRAVLIQAASVALAGALVGSLVSLALAAVANGSGTVIALPWGVLGSTCGLALIMALIAGNLAGQRVLRLAGDDITTERKHP